MLLQKRNKKIRTSLKNETPRGLMHAMHYLELSGLTALCLPINNLKEAINEMKSNDTLSKSSVMPIL